MLILRYMFCVICGGCKGKAQYTTLTPPMLKQLQDVDIRDNSNLIPF